MNRISAVLVALCLIVPVISAGDINFIPASSNTAIVRHKYYTLSYIDEHEDAEWVAYKLEGYMTAGMAKRSNKFTSDPDVPGGSAQPVDYSRSGYDRGHLCPAADMKWSAEATNETFYMSNMSPQEPGFNRGIWKRLEEQVREWAVELKTVYVVTGPILSDGLPTIGRVNAVSVPRSFYKIILHDGEHGRRAVAFLMPNEASSLPLTEYLVPIDSIETLTHIDFFPSLSAAESRRLEGRVHISHWTFLVHHVRAKKPDVEN